VQTVGPWPRSIFQDERSPLMRFVKTVRVANDEYERTVAEPRRCYDKVPNRVDRAAAYLAAVQKARVAGADQGRRRMIRGDGYQP
jgi:hypothetical protein